MRAPVRRDAHPTRASAFLLAVPAVIVALSITLSGCSQMTPLDPVERTVPPPPSDRDTAQVRASAAALDPCALVDEKQAKNLGFTDAPKRRLFSCVLTGDDGETITASSYAPFSQQDRFDLEPVDLDGVRAYRTDRMRDECGVWIPLDFESAISFTRSDMPGRTCLAPEKFARSAAETLRSDPSALKRKDTDGTEACQAFSKAIGALPKGRSLEPQTGYRDSLARCAVATGAKESALSDHGMALSYAPPSARKHGDVKGIRTSDPSRSIKGKDVYVTSGDAEDARTDDGPCSVVWDARAADAADHADDVIAAEAWAPTCEDAYGLAGDLIPILERPTKPATTPVPFYTPSDNDSPAAGACVDAADEAARGCIPADPDVDVPDDPATFIPAAEADPNVLCKAAADSVAEVMGDGFEAVTIRRSSAKESTVGCEFVRPDHSLVVHLSASTDPIHGDLPDGTVASGRRDSSRVLPAGDLPVSAADIVTKRGTAEALAVARTTPVDIDGHDALLLDDVESDESTTRIGMVALGKADEPGHLTIEIETMLARAGGDLDVDRVDRTAVEKWDDLAKALADDLLE